MPNSYVEKYRAWAGTQPTNMVWTPRQRRSTDIAEPGEEEEEEEEEEKREDETPPPRGTDALRIIAWNVDRIEGLWRGAEDRDLVHCTAPRFGFRLFRLFILLGQTAHCMCVFIVSMGYMLSGGETNESQARKGVSRRCREGRVRDIMGDSMTGSLCFQSIGLTEKMADVAGAAV